MRFLKIVSGSARPRLSSLGLISRRSHEVALDSPDDATPPSIPNTERGTAYECFCLQYLYAISPSQSGAYFRRSGGPHDEGQDLVGWWTLSAPSSRDSKVGLSESSSRLRVIAQCKADAKPIGPHIVRELEGTLASHSSEDAPTIGLLFSSSGFTEGAQSGAAGSTQRLALFHLEFPEINPDSPR